MPHTFTLLAAVILAAQEQAPSTTVPSPMPLASSPQSDTVVEATQPSEPPVPNEELKSPFSFQFNLDLTNAYFYRGILQEKDGVIVQPAARLTVNLFKQDDFKIDALFATWNSFHSAQTNAQRTDGFIRYWYECDLIAGFVLTKGELSLTTTYTFLTSPSDSFQTVEELDFTLAFDDSSHLGPLALHPYALLAIETGANGSDGANTGRGSYLELGVAPGFSFDLGTCPVAITFPVSVGLSLHNYYENAAGESDTFGFVQVGAKASVPLPFGDRYGSWTMYAGVAGLFLGDNTAGYNGGNHEQVIGTLGLQLNF